MAKKKRENYLDYIPRHNRLYAFHKNAKGHVEIKVENKGLFHSIAQKLFKKPRFSNIELDDFGSFVWEAMDGKRTIYEIGILVKEKFGKKADPLYDRLSKFIKILHDQHYVVYENKQKK